MRRFLPRFYVEAFVDPDERVDGAPAVWVHRPVIGVFQSAPVAPDGAKRHFNEVDEPALQRNEDLEHLLAAVESDAASLVAEKLPARGTLSLGEREVLASFFALLGIRRRSLPSPADASPADLRARSRERGARWQRRGSDTARPAALEPCGVFGRMPGRSRNRGGGGEVRQFARRSRADESNAASSSTGATNSVSARSGSRTSVGVPGTSASAAPASATSAGYGVPIRRASAVRPAPPSSKAITISNRRMRLPLASPRARRHSQPTSLAGSRVSLARSGLA